MYRKVDSSLDFTKREEEVLKLWREENVFRRQNELRKDGEVFTFYDGPPTANGKPHIGHILTRAIKDLIPRYHSMKGRNVLRKAGWDTHGLPVELEVEKALGINGKEQIEAYGIEAFIKACKISVWKYKKEWEEISERVGFWADMDDPYVTYEDEYIESEWWAIKQIWEKGLLYQGHKIVPYCPRCGTALASHEVAQGYQDVKETSIFVRFPVVGEEDCYFAAWTTTPWTLPSNAALAVNPDADYVLVERDEEGRRLRYYLAESLVSKVLGEETRLIKKMKGRELLHKNYLPLFDYAEETVKKSGQKAWMVLPGSFVTLSDGSGIVHMAPAFGEDDAKIGREFDLPFIQLILEDGSMSPEVTDFAGLFCKDADAKIIEKLARDGLLIKTMSYEHSYPFCWRCDTPLIYYARNGWFIRMTALRERLLENNAKVNWLPPSIGVGRMGNFLENVVDWAISRERYWGMPIPVWRCSCGHDHVVGSVEELRELSPDCPEELELHRPYIDQVHLNCPRCGGLMTRIPEVIDCWFDSGAMPFAQWHYPFENRDKFAAHFPADFISEAVDQTRGWFNSLLAISTLLFDTTSFNNCIVLGHVQDKDGQKMSKHKGNVIDPWSILDTEGADAVRWYFYSNSQPWLPSRFSLEAVNEGKRKFMGTLWNSYAFYVLYANIDGFNPSQYKLEREALPVMDRWILSRLNSLVRKVDEGLSRYDITGPARALENFVDELSNWYVRRGRERYWQSGMEQDKINAYLTLHQVLTTVAKLAAPFTPFIAEMIYGNLVLGNETQAPASVHLCDYPQPDERFIDEKLEEQMALVLELVALGRTARALSGLKTRQPLARLIIVGAGVPDEEYRTLVLDELNVKKLEWSEDESALQDYLFKPQLKLLGKRFGKDLPQLKAQLETLAGAAAWKELNRNGYLELLFNGETIRLAAEELIVESRQAEGFAAASDHGVTVALDTRLTEALIEEGLLREMTSKIQTMRKESGFEVTDRIELYLGAAEKLWALCERKREELMKDVLAECVKPLAEAPPELSQKSWDINEASLIMAMRRIEK